MAEQVQQENFKEQMHSLSIKEMLFKYVKFWPLFVASILLALLGSWLYLRWATDIFQSSGILLVQSEKSSNSIDKLEQVMTVDAMKDVQTEIEILKSRPMLERVVTALDLNFSYSVKGNIKESNVYKDIPFEIQPIQLRDSTNPFGLTVKFIDQNRFKVNDNSEVYSFGNQFSTPYGVFKLNRLSNGQVPDECKIGFTPTLNMAMALMGILEITPKLNTGIVTISAESTNPRLAADIVNQLMVEYGKVNIEDKNITTYNKLQFIDKRIKLMLSELDSINDRLVAFRETNKVVDPTAQSGAYLSRIEESIGKLNEQRVQITNANKIRDYLTKSASDFTLVPSSLGIEDPTLNGLIKEYNEAQIERKQLMDNAPSGNVLVVQANQKVDNLKQRILENVKNVKSAFGTVVGTLERESGSAMSQVSTIPSKERHLEDIKRDMESKLIIYNSLLETKEQAAIALAATISNTKIVQGALPVPYPVKPKKNAVRLLALIIGLLIPVGIIIIIELLNDKVTSRGDIEKVTEASILAEIGHSSASEALVVTKGNRKVIAEQFRILRSNLQYVLRNVEKPVILVTSSYSGEGKSFVSTNVAAAISLTNKKTIVLEFDIRKPKVLSHLGLPKRHGLTNYLLGKVAVEDLPMQVPGYEDLYVLPCGPLPPNPAELLLDPKLNDLFDYLKSYFDVIVMDTAPVGMVSDALTLSRFADCTLYIVREGHTLKKQIGLIDQHYTHGRLPKISIVINDAKAHAGTGYYGYGNGAGSGYFDEDEMPSNAMAKLFRWFGKKNGVSHKSKTKI